MLSFKTPFTIWILDVPHPRTKADNPAASRVSSNNFLIANDITNALVQPNISLESILNETFRWDAISVCICLGDFRIWHFQKCNLTPVTGDPESISSTYSSIFSQTGWEAFLAPKLGKQQTAFAKKYHNLGLKFGVLIVGEIEQQIFLCTCNFFAWWNFFGEINPWRNFH